MFLFHFHHRQQLRASSGNDFLVLFFFLLFSFVSFLCATHQHQNTLGQCSQSVYTTGQFAVSSHEDFKHPTRRPNKPSDSCDITPSTECSSRVFIFCVCVYVRFSPVQNSIISVITHKQLKNIVCKVFHITSRVSLHLFSSVKLHRCVLACVARLFKLRTVSVRRRGDTLTTNIIITKSHHIFCVKKAPNVKILSP